MTPCPIVILTLLANIFPARGIYPAFISSHPQLVGNGEKWRDFLRSHPMGKLYNLYHQVNEEAGLKVKEFDLMDPGADFDMLTEPDAPFPIYSPVTSEVRLVKPPEFDPIDDEFE